MLKKVKLFSDNLPRRSRANIAKKDYAETFFIEETLTYHSCFQIMVDKGTNLEEIDRILRSTIESSSKNRERFPLFINRLRDSLPEGARVSWYDLSEEDMPAKVELDFRRDKKD